VTIVHDVRGPGRLIVVGALVTALGLAIAATAPIFATAPIDRIQHQQTAGGFVVLFGWVALAWGTHKFGRS